MNAKDFFIICTSLPVLALIVATAFIPKMAHADTTEWAQSEGGRMRVVSLPADANGRIEAVLQIDLKPGWITYWREPGESGIPPKITLDKTSEASLTSLSFPVPKLIKNDEIEDIGYDASVSLPFVLQSQPGSDNEKTRLTAFIGVCLNICIPFEASFDIAKGQGNSATQEETDAIAAAKPRYRPLPRMISRFRVSTSRLTRRFWAWNCACRRTHPRRQKSLLPDHPVTPISSRKTWCATSASSPST